jgi:S1-C subfamily serine protease
MKRAALYSSSRSPSKPVRQTPTQQSEQPKAAAPSRWRSFCRRYERPILAGGGALFALLLVALHAALSPAARQITQKDIDAAVTLSLEKQPHVSIAAAAYEAIRESVVQVRSLRSLEDEAEADIARAVGTGVVILDSGVILTNLHVVAAAQRIGIVFADGLESDAEVLSVMPDQDLAVLQAKTLPDDLTPATLRSSADLRAGEEVIAIGYPFGIGPSVSAGVVSGLKREYRSPDGGKALSNLIQFDAAANPGSSGGPLVTAEGEVVGIVTGILNPTEQRVFIGIGFAVPIETAASAVGLPPF